MEVVLIFGSNLGDRATLIREAISKMEEIGTLLQLSSMYETAPWGFESSDTFYNQVAIYSTNCSPLSVLAKCMETEKALGRQRGPVRYSSRPIDIDILFYDSLVMETPELTIPHPRLTLRNFVLVPLCELLPDFIHPVHGKTITRLLTSCPDQSACTLLNTPSLLRCSTHGREHARINP